MLAALAVSAVLIAAILAYAEETLFDSRAFANRAVSVLEDEAGRVVAKLWNASRDVALSQSVTPISDDGPSGPSSIAPAPAEVSTSVKPLEHPEGDCGVDLRAYGANPNAEGIPQDGLGVFRQEMDRLLQTMVKKGASDLHLSCGSTAILRIDGHVEPLSGEKVLEPGHMIQLLLSS